MIICAVVSLVLFMVSERCEVCFIVAITLISIDTASAIALCILYIYKKYYRPDYETVS